MCTCIKKVPVPSSDPCSFFKILDKDGQAEVTGKTSCVGEVRQSTFVSFVTSVVLFRKFITIDYTKL